MSSAEHGGSTAGSRGFRLLKIHRDHWAAHPGVRSGPSQLTIGERAADVLKRYFGTWSALFAVAVWIAVWMLLQKTSFAWDKAPYILLNLCLSCLAAVQGIILQISANRGDRISSEVALHTERNTDSIKKLLAENTELTQAVKASTDVLDEIHRHVTALVPQAGEFLPPPADPDAGEQAQAVNAVAEIRDAQP